MEMNGRSSRKDLIRRNSKFRRNKPSSSNNNEDNRHIQSNNIDNIDKTPVLMDFSAMFSGKKKKKVKKVVTKREKSSSSDSNKSGISDSKSRGSNKSKSSSSQPKSPNSTFTKSQDLEISSIKKNNKNEIKIVYLTSDDDTEEEITMKSTPKPKKSRIKYGFKCDYCDCTNFNPTPYIHTRCYCTHFSSSHKEQVYYSPNFISIKHRYIPSQDGCTCQSFSPTPFIPDLCYCTYTKDQHPYMNNQLIRSWAYQIGPCCAASSIASCYNTFKSLCRGDNGYLYQEDIFPVFEIILDLMIHRRLWHLKKFLSSDDIKQVVDDMFKYAKDINTFITTLKKSDINKILVNTIDSNSRIPEKSKLFIKKIFLEYLKVIIGKTKLIKTKSTGYFGNWGIKQGVTSLQHIYNLELYYYFLMGKSKKVQNSGRIRRKDDENKLAENWNYLLSYFIDKANIIIFHLINHYSPIYGMREYPQREILTSARGQGPSIWISFDECKRIMLSWGGYGFMLISQNQHHELDE